MKGKIVNLDEKIRGKKLEEDLDEIKLDLEMIEKHHKEKVEGKYREAIVEFMDLRKNLGYEFEKWMSENITEGKELAFWSYMTETYQNLLLPSLDEFDITNFTDDKSKIFEKIDRAFIVAAALEHFHMSLMKNYVNIKNEKV